MVPEVGCEVWAFIFIIITAGTIYFSHPWFSIWNLNECPSLNNLLTYPDVVMLEEELQVRKNYQTFSQEKKADLKE